MTRRPARSHLPAPRRGRRPAAGGAALILVLGCGAADAPGDASTGESGGEEGGGGVVAPEAYDRPGPFAVGTRRVELPAAVGEDPPRPLTVQVWYPAMADSPGAALELPGYEAAGPRRAAVEALLEEADPSCVRRRGVAIEAADLAPGDGPWPAVLMSHCHDCVRWSFAAVAERLASHGVVVLAPDHAGNTLFDRLEGSPGALAPATLELRVGDMRRTLDAALEGGEGPIFGAGLGGAIDPDRVGMVGHSFGAMTLGRVLQDDPRVRAGVALAAPLSFFPGTDLSALDAPLLHVRALEDNSIGVVGNEQIELQFAQTAGPAWLVDVADAGHWSFFDIAGLDPAFGAGCGEGERQTVPGEAFAYLDNERARGIAASYAARFFALTLGAQLDPDALTTAIDPAVVEIRAR